MTAALPPSVPWSLRTLLAGQVARWLGPAPESVAVDALTLDVNEVRPGTLFIARVGWYGDTHDRLAEAIARGAAALVVTRPEALPQNLPAPAAVAVDQDPTLARLSARLYGQPTLGLEVHGITGTNGKTSTAGILEHLLRAVGQRPARMGTIDFCFESQSIAASNTTPDALVIQRFAHDARHLGATALVLEASSHGLALGRLAEVAFDAVGFTNLSRDHLDFHGTVAHYRAAKASLFDAHLVAAQAAGKHPVAVAWVGSGADDEGLRMLRGTPEGTLCLAVGNPAELAATVLPPRCLQLAAQATALPDLAGQRCHFDLRGQHPELGALGLSASVDLPLIGAHNLQNAAVALGMVVARDPRRFASAVQALAQVAPVPGRLERVGPRTWVDYAHTPDAVARILAAVRAGTPLPLRVVLGCGGDRDPGKRGPMARAAVEACQGQGDGVWFTADNPRSEDPEIILDAMFAALTAEECARVHREPDRAGAIEAALSAPGEAVVLILGKGHETTQTIGTQVLHFDDRQVARRALRALEAGLAPADAPRSWGLAHGAASDGPPAPSPLAITGPHLPSLIARR